MLERTQDQEEIIERVAALDIAKRRWCAAYGYRTRQPAAGCRR